MKKLIWHTEKRKIKELIPTENNPRRMTEKQAKDLERSLTKFNLVEIPCINLDNRIVSGHQRVSILSTLGRGEETIDVRVPNRRLTEEEHQEYLIRANKNTGEWNLDLLVNFDENLLKDIGFGSEELDKIFQLDTPDEDDVPEVKKTNIKTSDLFQLEKHRLLCGNSTKKEDVEKLMAGEKADMVFTDPPYGIDLNTDYTGIMNRGKKYNKVIGDNKKWDFNKANWFDIKEQFWWGADNYRQTLPDKGSWFVWDKQISDHDGRSHTGNLFELCWSKEKHRGEIIKVPYFRFYGMDTKERLHPTQKPVKIVQWFIEKFSERGQNIIDLFGGSGSTLIACEQLNRKCRMMEIEPIYVQTIIDRWEKFTGKQTIKL